VTENACGHEWSRIYFEWGKIEVRNGERSRPFWNVRECKKCGKKRRQADRYTGSDMATIHEKWTTRIDALYS
jgi:hypothetical protein